MNEHFTNSDKLASVVGVVGEVITTMAITVARECQTKMLFILGLLLIIIPYYEKLLRIILFYEDVILFILKMVHFQVQWCPSFKLIQTKNIINPNRFLKKKPIGI